MSEARPANSAARRICSGVARSAPKAMFCAMLALNRNVSCGTKPIWRRNAWGDSWRRSTPSRSTDPAVGSSNLGIRLTSVLLPHPVAPTMATAAPAGIRRLSPLTAGPVG